VYADAVTKADLHQLVDELPDEAVESTAVLLERIRLHQFDPNQAWIWSEQWQQQLRGSFADVGEGRTQRFDNGDDLLTSLPA